MDTKKVQKIFAQHDSDGSGTISVSELTLALKDLKVEASEQEVASLMKDIDVDGSGELNVQEFELLFGEARLRGVFNEIDADQSGQIGDTELREAMRCLGHDLSAGEVRRLLAKVDADQSGEVHIFCSLSDALSP
jgi:Ca2+-binding EF-hand superfamily protein